MLCAIERMVRDRVKPADFEFTIGAVAGALQRSWPHANGKSWDLLPGRKSPSAKVYTILGSEL